MISKECRGRNEHVLALILGFSNIFLDSHAPEATEKFVSPIKTLENINTKPLMVLQHLSM